MDNYAIESLSRAKAAIDNGGFKDEIVPVTIKSRAGETVVDTDIAYRADDPVLIRVRRREHRYDLTDDGGAVGRAGRPPGWLAVAQRVVAGTGMNVNRRGVVFVPAVEGRDLDALGTRLAETSRLVYLALLEL